MLPRALKPPVVRSCTRIIKSTIVQSVQPINPQAFIRVVAASNPRSFILFTLKPLNRQLFIHSLASFEIHIRSSMFFLKPATVQPFHLVSSLIKPAIVQPCSGHLKHTIVHPCSVHLKPTIVRPIARVKPMLTPFTALRIPSPGDFPKCLRHPTLLLVTPIDRALDPDLGAWQGRGRAGRGWGSRVRGVGGVN